MCRTLSLSCMSIGSMQVGQHTTADSLVKQTTCMPFKLLQKGTFSACCGSTAVDLPVNVDELADRSSCDVGFLVSAGVSGLGAVFILVTSFVIASPGGLPALPALILPDYTWLGLLLQGFCRSTSG